MSTSPDPSPFPFTITQYQGPLSGSSPSGAALPSFSYFPGQQYVFVIQRTINPSNKYAGFLFQIVTNTPGIPNINGRGTYTMTANDAANTVLGPVNRCVVPTAAIGHRFNRCSGGAFWRSSDTFQWNAPATGTDDLRVFFVGVENSGVWWRTNVLMPYNPCFPFGALPSNVAIVNATTVTNTTINVKWNAPVCTGTGGLISPAYRITVYDSNDAVVGTQTSDSTAFSVSGLSPASSYKVTIEARNAAGMTWTNSTVTTCDAVCTVDPPGTPTFSNIGSASATVTWTAPASFHNAAFVSYTAQFQGTAGAAPAVWTNFYTGTGLSAVLTGLLPEKTYNVRVLTTTYAGDSAYNGGAQVTTTAVSACPSNNPNTICSGNGQCIQLLGVCDCDTNHLGLDCSLTAPSDGAALGPNGHVRFHGDSDVTGFLNYKVTWPGTGFLGLGTGGGSLGMDGMDALILYANPGLVSGSVVITCEHRIGSAQSTPSLSADSQTFCTNIAGVKDAVTGHVTAYFRRPMAAQGQGGKAIPLDGSTQLSWSMGDSNAFVQHQASNRGRFQVNFVTGVTTALPGENEKKWIPFLVGWFICAVAAIILRFESRNTETIGTMLWHRRMGALSQQPTMADKASLGILPIIKAMTIGEFMAMCLYLICWIPYLVLGKKNYDDGNREFYYITGNMTALHCFFTILLPTRNSIWLPIFGISFERIIKYHRWCGQLFFFLLIIHGSIMWDKQTWSVITQTTATVNGQGNLYGPIAFLFFALIYLTAYEGTRRTMFEVFYYLHIPLAWTGVALAMVHSDRFKDLAVAPIILYGLDRCVRFYRSWFKEAKVEKVTALRGRTQVTRLRIKIPGFYFEAGQYVFLRAPAVSLFQWHPFSLSSPPSSDGTFTLHIMDMGPGTFTNGIASAAKEDGSFTVNVDGPYGALSVRPEYYPIVVLVAGGVGITPMMSLFADLYNRARAQILSPTVRKVILIWACTNPEPFQTWYDELLTRMAAEPVADKFETHFYVTKGGAPGAAPARAAGDEKKDSAVQMATVGVGAASSSDEKTAPRAGTINRNLTNGRPNYRNLLNGFLSLAAGEGVKAHHMSVFACGPEPMINDVQATSHELGAHFHSETFFL